LVFLRKNITVNRHHQRAKKLIKVLIDVDVIVETGTDTIEPEKITKQSQAVWLLVTSYRQMNETKW